MKWLDHEAIEHISYGAAILASGGGGDPYIGKIMAQRAIAQHGPIQLVTLDELQPEALLLATGMIGSPTIMMEKVPNGQESLLACRHIAEHMGRPLSAIYPIETGGINSLLPLASACILGLPVADVDAMGRAFPEFHMTTFYLDGINASPFAVVDEHANAALVEAQDSLKAEKLARAVAVKMGGAAAFAGYPITVDQARVSGIAGTLGLMWRIGVEIQQARADRRNVIDTLTALLQGIVLFRGKANRVNQRSEGGFNYGTACFIGVDDDRGGRFDVLFQNEYLLARRDDRALCMTPDLIILLDEETGLPILGERLCYGMRVVALGVPAHEKWRTPRGIEVCGPRYFHYPDDYTPVETLAARYKEESV
ncbi:DUF917 domain-containing protein [Candidatus Sodalis sp. SoCistrobi]|uniref:DUF917 domain-containing protein n=1 Tax=Candidatus Sodalis sp. SoCistrobi TaxID=1922216 RepID=UPI00093EABE1|nr:DUF917 domain-containing protein [Candidatus Sodalis sp. SoCistrobi]